MTTLQAYLRDLRHERFVDREADLARLRVTLTGPVPLGVVALVGPPGIGKSALFSEFARCATELGVPIAVLDASTLSDPQALARAASEQLGSGAQTLDQLFAVEQRQVLALDRYIPGGPLDAALRTALLGGRGETLVLLAMRTSPPASWFNDPEWGSLLEEVRLDPLPHAASRQYLERAGVAGELLAAAVELAAGHPLTLFVLGRRLLASTDGLSTAVVLDTARTVLELALQADLSGGASGAPLDPGCVEWAALGAAAVAGVLSESVLRAALPEVESGSLFRWLCRQPVVAVTSYGLVIREPFATFLLESLAWRDPERSELLRERVRQASLSALRSNATPARLPHVIRLLALADRDGSFRRGLVGALARGIEVSPLRGDEFAAALSSMEPPELAEALRPSLSTSSALVRGLRDSTGRLLGWLSVGPLNGILSQPGLANAFALPLEQLLALRPGERATLHLIWLAPEVRVPPRELVALALAVHLERLAQLPQSVLSLFLCGGMAEEASWCWSFLGVKSLAPGSSSASGFGGERGEGTPRLVIAVREWRRQTVLEWLADPEWVPPVEVIAATDQVLDRETFTQAVQQALRDYTRPERLRGNPLLESRMVRRGSGLTANERQRIEVLRAILAQVVGELGQRPQYRRWQQVVESVYFRPLESQERMAERLGIPFSTYRRYLKNATSWIAEFCWQLEVSGEDLTPPLVGAAVTSA